jgi:photosystem II stability/assembly factor-like uncharacterized protein/tetratricopeptide (TPR) repeat protein
MFVLLAWLLATALEGAEPVEPSDPLRADAQLADLTFVDRSNGWAVGDRGTIWHTSDGGQHWTLQRSGVDCRLASVFFLDAQVGWAAGGATQPYTHAAGGVLLHTRDGGETWTLKRKLALPSIERIRFFDANRGWAFGRSSAVYPSGVFSTEDGGRSWSALPAAESRPWLAGDFIDPHTGALAGRLGTSTVIRRRGVEPPSTGFGLRALVDMKLTAPAAGWLVGEGGLALKSRDLGKTWQTTDGEIPPAIRNHFDFSALAVRGEQCWIAGSPGTRVLHSADGGRSWNAGDTEQSLPIQALAFVDDKSGYAVGDLGTILMTRDGGRSWTRQRGGGLRAAYAGFYGRPTDIPLELVAQLSADDGYLAAIEILNRDDVELPGSDDRAAQAHEACVRAGASAGCSAWRFPMRQASLKLTAEQLVEVWNQANDGKSLEKLEAYVVERIRMWRPNVVFMPAADVRSGDAVSHIINQIVLRAVEHAGDAAQFSEQLGEVGLRPWSVQKVYATLGPGQPGTPNINTSQLAGRLGVSIGELAAPARGVIADDFSPPPGVVGFRLLVDHIPQQVGQRDFFSGIPLSPGGEARRALDELTAPNMDAMRREVQLRRNLQAILARSDNDERDGRFVADFAQQTRLLEPARAAEVLFQLGERYHRQGRWELAAECFDLVVERYPTNPLAGKSLVWLVQYYASSEAAWRNRATQQHTIEQVSAQAPLARGPKAGGETIGRGSESARARGGARREAVISAGAEVAQAGGLVLGTGDAQERWAKAAGYAKQIEELQPALYAEPVVRFPLAAAHRQQGLPRQAERFYLGLRNTRPRDAWRDCAVAELWLGEPKSEPPKEICECRRAPAKPRLDGRLDEPCWQAAAKVELHSSQRDDGEWGAVAMLAYDDEFLYIGISCTRAEGFKYATSDEPRPRDADLADQDRVELLIDVDRDFATYYQLVVDCRGWTAESCWRDKTWNPNWFVASGETDGAWTAEAAIALSELTDQQSLAKKTWALGIQRIVPGVGFQSWTTPAASTAVPEGFGYLIFR